MAMSVDLQVVERDRHEAWRHGAFMCVVYGKSPARLSLGTWDKLFQRSGSLSSTLGMTYILVTIYSKSCSYHLENFATGICHEH